MNDKEIVTSRIVWAAIRYVHYMRYGVRKDQTESQKELVQAVDEFTRPTNPDAETPTNSPGS